jgi:hypothetical protein
VESPRVEVSLWAARVMKLHWPECVAAFIKSNASTVETEGTVLLGHKPDLHKINLREKVVVPTKRHSDSRLKICVLIDLHMTAWKPTWIVLIHVIVAALGDLPLQTSHLT